MEASVAPEESVGELAGALAAGRALLASSAPDEIVEKVGAGRSLLFHNGSAVGGLAPPALRCPRSSPLPPARRHRRALVRVGKRGSPNGGVRDSARGPGDRGVRRPRASGVRKHLAVPAATRRGPGAVGRERAAPDCLRAVGCRLEGRRNLSGSGRHPSPRGPPRPVILSEAKDLLPWVRAVTLPRRKSRGFRPGARRAGAHEAAPPSPTGSRGPSIRGREERPR